MTDRRISKYQLDWRLDIQRWSSEVRVHTSPTAACLIWNVINSTGRYNNAGLMSYVGVCRHLISSSTASNQRARHPTNICLCWRGYCWQRTTGVTSLTPNTHLKHGGSKQQLLENHTRQDNRQYRKTQNTQSDRVNGSHSFQTEGRAKTRVRGWDYVDR